MERIDSRSGIHFRGLSPVASQWNITGSMLPSCQSELNFMLSKVNEVIATRER